jgi:peptidoglycan hydrolase CwlO-like protein
MDNLLLITIFGVLALYFFSSTSVYKSMYKKIKHEKDSTLDAKNTRDKEIVKYENRLKNAILTIKDTEESLTKSRDEVQKLRQTNSDLKRRNELLQERVDELYSSVGMI